MPKKNQHEFIRDQRAYIRLSTDEKKQLLAKVEKTDTSSISEYMRSVALGYPVKSTVTHEAINELRRLGGLVKHLFLEGGREDPNGMYLATLNDLRVAIKRLGRDQ